MEGDMISIILDLQRKISGMDRKVKEITEYYLSLMLKLRSLERIIDDGEEYVKWSDLDKIINKNE